MPLQELTEELGQREEEHTQELAQAIAQLATIHTVGQKLVLSKNEIEIARLVVDAAWQVLHVPVCGLWLVDDEQKSIARLVYTSRKEPHKTLPPFSLDDEQGIVVSVARLGEPIYLPDTSQEPRYVDGGFHSRSELCVPLRVGEQVIGALNAESEKLDGFGPADRQLLEALANSAAIAIKNARLFQERERRVIELAIVNEIGQAVSSALEMDALLETVYHQVGRLFDTTNFVITTHKEASGEWALAFWAERGLDQSPTWHTIEEGVSGYVIRNRQSVLWHSAEDILAFHADQGLDPIGEIPCSWMAVPLIAADKVVGTMSIRSYEHENLYDEQDLFLFSTVAAQVATAIDNLRSLEKARRRAREMEAINKVGQTITSVLDLDTVLRQIVDATKARFDHYYVGIILVEENRLVFRCGSSVGDSDIIPEFDLLAPDLIYDSSLIAEAAQTGQPVLVNDVLDDPRYRPVEELPDTRCELCIPIKVRGRVIGVLDVENDRPFAYDQSDVAFHQSLADQAGAAIENARLFENARIHAEELAILNELAQVLTARLSVEQVLDEAYQGISRLVNATNFYVALYDPDNDEVTFALDVTEGNVRRFFGTRQAGEGITEHIIRNRTALLLQDNLPEQLEKLDIKIIGQVALSWLGVPLMIGDQVIGVMAVQSHTTSYAFDEHDLDLLTAIASQVAIAIQNARLYEAMQQELVERKRAEEEAQRRAAQTALIYKVGQRVSSKLELKALLSEIVTAVHDAFDYYSVMLFLLDAEVRRLTLQSIAGGYVNIFPSDLSIAVGEGMIGHAATTGETQISGDVNQDPHYMRKVDEMTQSELAAPIKSKQKVIGVLDLQSNSLNAFDETDVILMETLADQVAGAIENARLYEAIQQELTERKRVEEALAYERDLLHALMDNTPDAIYFKDVDSRFVRVNRTQAQVLLGVNDPDKAIGKTDFDFFTEGHAQDAYEDEQEIVRSGQPLTDKLEGIRRADGQIRWVSTTKIPLIGKGGQVAGTIGITRDITERKQAEEQLQRYAAEMERANEEVKKFAYIVSHDLRAPLVNLKGFAAELDMALSDIQSAIDTALPHLSEDQRQTITYALHKDIPESLKFINSSVEHMDSFISALLKLSRLGRRELKLEQVDMNDVVDAILPTLAHQIAEHQGEVKVEQLPNVVADRTSMEQIMSNILSNAVKYLTSDRPAEIKVTAERNDDETIFRIQDNGCGIAESDMEKIFTPFRRAGKQDVPGEGMGLAYVQTLVRRHGGRIWCESKPETGTTFTFTLPNHPKGADYA